MPKPMRLGRNRGVPGCLIWITVLIVDGPSAVRPVLVQPSLSQSPGNPEVAGRSRVHRIPLLPPVLCGAEVHQILVVSLSFPTLPRDPCIHDFLSSYPGPTIRALELLQQERFRKDILIPETVARMAEEGLQASTDGLRRD